MAEVWKSCMRECVISFLTIRRADNGGQSRILQDGCPYRMIDSIFFKELPLKMGAHICGIDRFHIYFNGAKIGIFRHVSKPGIPSPVLSAKQPHRKVPCVRNVDGCGAPMPDIGPWRTRWGVLYVHRGCRCAAVWREDDVRMDEIPRRCACGISCRPRGSGQPF